MCDRSRICWHFLSGNILDCIKLWRETGKPAPPKSLKELHYTLYILKKERWCQEFVVTVKLPLHEGSRSEGTAKP